MQKRNYFKKLISFIISLVIIMTSAPAVLVHAEETSDKYPYTMFAGSYEDGSITINADNICVNGNMAANGSIVTSGSMNCNGTKAEYVMEDMIYIFDKIDAAYFSGNDVEIHNEDYMSEDTNITITHPLETTGTITLNGNINISTAIQALGTVSLNGEIKNTEGSFIISKYGDIVIDSQNVNINGLLYAPFGEITITAQNLSLNNVIIIADSITINCPNLNTNYDSNVAAFVGNTSELLNIPQEEWKYMDDENENGLPDFFEDIFNWGLFEDTDSDHLPDVIEVWMGTNPNSRDTDGDGIDDYYEEFVYLTDPVLADSDGNGIPDGEEDPDGDGLTNIEEYGLRSHPLYADTDGDGLNDYEETATYLTNPNEKDTDGDGADDAWELENGYDPNVYNDTFHIYAESTGKNITASVSMDAAGSMVQSLTVEPADEFLLLNDTTPGYIGSPFRFEINGEFEQAELSFTFDSEYLGDEDFVPTIYYYNEETQLLEEMPTTVDGNTASTTTTHFSVYVLLNKTTYEAAWQTIKTPNNNENIDEINIAFVVDTSGSMRGTKITTAKNVIRNFVEKIRTNHIPTNVALVKFSSSASVVNELSNDYDTFLQNLNTLNSNGLTSIYTGLDTALDVLTANDSSSYSYDAVILLTDGYDEPTTTYTMYQPYVDEAVNAGINIYTIGVGTIDEQLLIKLSDETGGNYFYASNAAALYDIYEEIETEIIDYTTDSNNDGICDYYTKLLCDGTLRVGTQCNLFDGISYEAVQANDDYDGDGLLNGEEFEVQRDEETGRVYVYLHSNPFDRDSDSDGMEDSIDDDSMNAGTGFLIYQTIADDNAIKNCPLEERPEDYQYADKSIEQLEAMRYINWSDFFIAEKEDYVLTWKTMVYDLSKGEMRTVSIDMVNHVLDGTGADYYNNILTKNVEEYETTEPYVESVTNIINSYIEENNGDISGLAYISGINRDEGIMVSDMQDKDIYLPVYSDKFGGLGICVDGLYGNRIEMTSYSFDGQNYEYTLRFTLYDIYGLDSADIEEKKAISKVVGFGILPGFRGWYILQHCNLYQGNQPYISYMIFEQTKTGSIK